MKQKKVNLSDIGHVRIKILAKMDICKLVRRADTYYVPVLIGKAGEDRVGTPCCAGGGFGLCLLSRCTRVTERLGWI